jgi:hypothetical protein
MARAAERGEIDGMTETEAAELYLTLLIGDLQIRRVIGAIGPPDTAAVTARARQARARFVRLAEA